MICLSLRPGFAIQNSLKKGNSSPEGRSRVYGDASGRKTVDLAPGNGAKVAGTEKYQELILVGLGKNIVMEPEACKTDGVRDAGLEIVGAVVKKLGVKGERFYPGRADNVDGNRNVVIKAGVEKLHFEGQLFIPPQRLLRLVSDIAPLIVIDLQQERGNASKGIFKWSLSKLAGFPDHVFQTERRLREPPLASTAFAAAQSEAGSVQ